MKLRFKLMNTQADPGNVVMGFLRDQIQLEAMFSQTA